jgi:hypothetical protein
MKFALGPEIMRVQRGETSFTIRHQWVVAFAFGLLYGFGFASGLATICRRGLAAAPCRSGIVNSMEDSGRIP